MVKIEQLKIKKELDMQRQELRQRRLQLLINEVASGRKKKLADMVGIASSSISRMLYPKDKAGAKTITEKTTDKIEKALDLPTGWFDNVTNEHDEKTSLNTIDKIDSIYIKIYNVTASMGHGMHPSDFEIVINDMKVSKTWLRKELPQISSISNLQIIAGVGDSMYPTYSSGDLLLVDTGAVNILSDSIYVFSYNGATYVKRIFINPVDKTINVKSDNPSATDWPPLKPEELDDFIIHGRIIYAWKGFKL